MTLTDWNWLLERDNQDYPWDCSACSTAWALRTIGRNYTEQDVIVGLGPSRISPQYGLLDATGAGLVEWLGEIGCTASNNPNATWNDIQAAAGYQPLLLGGRNWCHWVAVRMGSDTANRSQLNALALMNPAPGWGGIDQVLGYNDWARLGAWSAVWITGY